MASTNEGGGTTVNHDYDLDYNFETGCYILDVRYEANNGAEVRIDENDDNLGIITKSVGGGRPKGTKVTMKKRTIGSNSGNIPVTKLEVSKVTVIKTVKKNDDEKDDHWNYDYQFTFEMFTNVSYEDITLTLKHKQNGKEHQFNIPTLRGRKEIEINLDNEDTALFDITKTVIGENTFDVILSCWFKPFEDVITDFTVDLSELNLIQKGSYAAQRTAGNVKD